MLTCYLHRWFHCVLAIILLIATLAPSVQGQVNIPQATPTPLATLATPLVEPTLVTQVASEEVLTAQVEALLTHMSPADRVGQLFIISFEGADTGPDSDIADLIYTYRIGGVVLSPQRNNFSNAKGIETPRQVATLVNQLQGLTYGRVLASETALAPAAQSAAPGSPLVVGNQEEIEPPNIPLFIAIEQLGDDLPATALRRGFTPLPSQMALGATWNLDLVRKVGQIVGRELQAVGVNLLLGPNLDVFDQPRTDSVGALGLHSFGGNPYWVSQMGRAYIAGVHDGGGGRVATIARHFPGQGNIDRLPQQEIATVQQSIEELRQTAFVPFRDVTRQTSLILQKNGDLFSTDGLMTSYMRYSALFGNTSPISLGPELSAALEQEGFADWHNNGGLLVSNAIGVPAIRRYYDPTLLDFPYLRIALDIFSAGHDLIYLDQLSSDGDWPTERRIIQEIIEFFHERYNDFPDFATQVDNAVRRTLRLKLRLYGESYVAAAQLAANNPSTPTVPITVTQPLTAPLLITAPTIPISRVLTSADALTLLGEAERIEATAVVGQTARESLTILYPDAQSLATLLPAAPKAEDRLLIFSDSRLLSECLECTAEAALGPDAIAGIIDQLYGSAATGQIPAERVASYTFSELDELLRSQTAPTEGDATATPVAPPIITTTNTAPAIVSETSTILDTGELITPTAETLDKLTKLENLIDESNWILFAMLDVDRQTAPASDVVKRFLGQRSEQLENKRVAVFALNAPYFLDATEISKLTVYYGVYSKSRPFLENAVRALFRSYTPTGSPPVSVPGTQFASLAERLQPNPVRAIPLRIMIGESELVIQPEADTKPVVHVGDVLRLRAGPILDLNGRPVPNGVIVSFNLIYEGETLALNIEPALTRNGVATREVTLDRTGSLLVAANAGNASTGEPIALDVQATGTGSLPITPTLALTVPAPLVAENNSPAPGPTPALESDLPALPPGERVNLITLVIALFTILITLSLLLIAQVQILPRQVLVHNMLWATIFGLVAYILYGLGFIPGVMLLQQRLDVLGPAVVVFIAMLLPLLWLQLRTEQLQ